MNQQHDYHLVDNSPWPFFVSIGLLFMTIGGSSYLHFFLRGGLLLFIGFVLVATIFSFWTRDVVREGTFGDFHHKKVQKSLRLGMLLFIVSEVLFFLAFFWAFFHSSLAPSVVLGSVWPPYGLEVLQPFQIPLLNTVILLTSGATITLAHHALLINDRPLVIRGFQATIALAVLFTALQAFEYFVAPFSIADGVYGSTFYLATGFHGLHVIIGTIFIFVGMLRYLGYHLTPNNHFGFEAAAWYWHFVDVVWLFLFISVYVWGCA